MIDVAAPEVRTYIVAGAPEPLTPVKKPRRDSPTRRSLQYLRNRGAMPWVTEKWNPFIKKRMDMWGFGDIVAVEKEGVGFLIIQSTTSAHVAERLTKMRSPKIAPRILRCLAAQNRVVIHGWSRAWKNGRASWNVRVVVVTKEMLEVTT